MKNLTHNKIIKEILENVHDDMQDEEIIHLVLEKPIANNKQENSYSDRCYITGYHSNRRNPVDGS